jgi:4-coumarate--CoA ligase
MWDPKQWSGSAAVGELVPNCEAKIMDDNGTKSLGPGEKGELWCRAPTVMKGYWHNEPATKETVTEDGWLKTGDIAVRDSQGKYHIVDRKKVRRFP